MLILRKAHLLSLSRTRARYLHRPKTPQEPIWNQQAARALGDALFPIPSAKAVLDQLPWTFAAVLAQAWA
ncbi:MAG: hypothetical protein SFV17_03825 [Candidatus Obscuribacter sp.]|nr:hypothetical protein [Candidatus Obscuribacter sp.]